MHGSLVVTGLDQAAEPCRPGHVGALADHHEAGIRADLERFQAAEPRCPTRRRHSAALEPRDRRGDLLDVRGRGPATSADNIHQPCFGEFPQHARCLVGLLVVAAEGVGQAGVGMAAHVRAGQPGQLGDVRPHLLGPEGAVDADDERAGVLDRRPECLDRLPG